jgi:anti-sigma B factor antagonist
MPAVSPRTCTHPGPGPHTAVVTLPAEIDTTNSEQVRQALVHAVCGASAVLIADATLTTFCDCAGVVALTHAYQQATAAGAQLRVAASPAVQHIIKLIGTSLLDTYPTVDAALGSDRRPSGHPLTQVAGGSEHPSRI